MVRSFGFVLSGLVALASLRVVALMLFIAVDVLSRALFAAPILGQTVSRRNRSKDS